MNDLSREDLRRIESLTQRYGRELFDRIEGGGPSVLQRRWWDDRLMRLAMRDEGLKAELFRFVDVLPMLGGSGETVRHLEEYLGRAADALPASARWGLRVAAKTAATRRILAWATRVGAMDFARRFIAGTTARQVMNVAAKYRQRGFAFTLDILGETVAGRGEAQRYFEAYLSLIEQIAPTVNAWPEVPIADRGPDGPMPRVNISIKLSSLDAQFDAIDFKGATDRVAGRLRDILRTAREHGAFVHVDMESYAKKDLTLHIFQTVLGEPEFCDTPDVGIVLQCYLRDTPADLENLRNWVRRRGTPITVRLVKGAYWDYETAHARANGWPIPVWQQKHQSDACFEAATRFTLRNHEYLRTALGTHNIRSMAHGLATAEFLQLPPEAVEYQVLYGMADAEKEALAALDRRVRVYMPYGELIPGMAYLVRRLLENTSNDSFLRTSLERSATVEELLAEPIGDGEVRNNPSEPSESAAFENHPPIDFAVESNRRAMCEALRQVADEFGQNYDPLVNGETIACQETIDSVDPARKDRVIGRIGMASAETAERAVAAAVEALPVWHGLGFAHRAHVLRRLADQMTDRFFELSAWIVFECAKPWREATGDVCEAIDFCRYYALQAERLGRGDGLDVPGEENRFGYLPIGPTAVIAPWNFPLAILTGMTTAALVAGNPVVIKPAGTSSVIAAKLVEMLGALDLPPGVVNYLPGRGSVIGNLLVEHRDIALVAFTGSREVGLGINIRAAEASARHGNRVKRVIAEMGGKNGIIVDDDADLDEAVPGIVKSAFGYQGQKCSACSRVVVLEAIHDALMERLIDAAASLRVAPAEEPGCDLSALIDEPARQRVLEYIAVGREEGREALAVDAGPLAEQGYFVGPHIFDDVKPEARIAREEIFGPVLSVLRARDLDEAFRIANGTDYALTGGMFSRSPAHLDRARRELHVGNVYLNRNITGALVGRQPFGGFKMSGIGSKAGGRDYLLQFVLPRTVTENTMRRGFVPPAAKPE